MRQRAGVRESGPGSLGQSPGIHLDFIRPGHPVENCFIESFNGKLRDECLSQYHFATLAEARHRIEQWRQSTTPSGRTAAWGTAPQRSTPHASPPRRGTPQP
ncbi:MAG: transposase [Gemmatimonadetes bacterium]|nr:transposase [Gemmatimonadota bacterium]